MTDWAGLFAIAAMALATYGLRISGFWLMGRVPLTPRVRRGLEALPGCVLISIVLPSAVMAGFDALLCIAVAALAMAFLRRDFLAVGMALLATILWRAAF